MAKQTPKKCPKIKPAWRARHAGLAVAIPPLPPGLAVVVAQRVDGRAVGDEPSHFPVDPVGVAQVGWAAPLVKLLVEHVARAAGRRALLASHPHPGARHPAVLDLGHFITELVVPAAAAPSSACRQGHRLGRTGRHTRG